MRVQLPSLRATTPVFATLLAGVVLPFFAAWTAAQEGEPATQTLEIAKIEVQPDNPGADTLCRLTVTVRNHGEEKASQLGFAVRLNGQDLTVYANQLFMYAVPPGGEIEIPLYNFWTTETSRPTMPENGRFQVEVSLLEAQWMDISMVTETVERAGAETEEEVEVWTPLGAVEGLPVSAEITLQTAGS